MISKNKYSLSLMILFIVFASLIGYATESISLGIASFLGCFILRFPKVREIYDTTCK